MITEIWRIREGENDTLTYRVQTNEVRTRTEPKLFEHMKEWKLAGEAWGIANENKTYIFQKTFDTEEQFKSWLRDFPWEYKEYSSTSDRVKSHTKIKKAKRVSKKGRPKARKQTQCKICMGFGHNTRTCPKKENK